MLKALAIEDGEDIKQLLRDELEDKGYKVIEACNGEINLEQATQRFHWNTQFGSASSH